MSGKLAREIHRLRPFDCLEQEVSLNVLRTADFLLRGLEEMLKPYRLSGVQFNVLRILRGAGADGPGMACKQIAEHMLTRDPDVTRLLDRLAARGLVVRTRDTHDRRVVASRITPAGLDLLAKLDEPVLAFHRAQLAHVQAARLRAAVELLEDLRSPDAPGNDPPKTPAA